MEFIEVEPWKKQRERSSCPSASLSWQRRMLQQASKSSNLPPDSTIISHLAIISSHAVLPVNYADYKAAVVSVQNISSRVRERQMRSSLAAGQVSAMMKLSGPQTKQKAFSQNYLTTPRSKTAPLPSQNSNPLFYSQHTR
jgi:hypothetical protein